MRAVIKTSSITRNTFVCNGLNSGIGITVIPDITSIGYPTATNHNTIEISKNIFVIKGKNLEWHNLGLTVVNQSTNNNLIIEKNIFNFNTNVSIVSEICQSDNWLRDDLYSMVEFSDNILKHQNSLSFSTEPLGRRVITKVYNEIWNMISGVKTKLIGTSPYKESLTRVQRVDTSSSVWIFGKYTTGDLIKYNNDTSTAVTTGGYITSQGWLANTNYYKMDDYTHNPFMYSGTRVFKATTNGLSGGILPSTFATATIGDLIVDGTITWQYVGLLAVTS